MWDPTSQAGASQPRIDGGAGGFPDAPVRTSHPADFACAITYCRASAHARENVGRVAPLPGVSVQRAIASMSAWILSTFTAICVCRSLPRRLLLRHHPAFDLVGRQVFLVRGDPP